LVGRTGGVVVTGGADGIGRAIAEAFLSSGRPVHICDVRADALRVALAESPGLSGTVADVGDRAAVAGVYEAARAAMGEVHVLVNNVGVGGPRGPIELIDPVDWAECFRINVAGALYGMQAVIPEMKARKSGVIINISTASTRTALPMRTPYVASKTALEGLTRNAARELGPWNIRCNALLPGIMDNARMDGLIAARAEREARSSADVEADYLRFVSMRARIRPDDVAQSAVFLASDGAARVTGEILGVSGNLEWEE
jgi:NAD(P)-dependent dehydrogenase (short-subunit alcohol dehydrogenase family)